MSRKSMSELFIEHASALYQTERRSMAILPEIEKAATSSELASAIHSHVGETRRHAERLDEVFRRFGARPDNHESRCARGLLEDCMAIARDRDAEPHVRDAAIIAAIQHLEHEEIAGYGCLRTWARLLGDERVAEILSETLAEEKQSDAELTRIAERLNAEALAAA